MNGTFNTLIDSEKPVLIDFYANWCEPCKVMGPILHQVKENLGNRISVIKVNIDNNPAIAEQYNVRSVPTLVLFQNGKLLWRQSGVMSKDQLIGTILEKANP